MKKEKLLLIGYRAYGDWLYTAPLLPYLFKKYDVHIELNRKGYELFYDDPRFENVTLCPLEDYPVDRVFELTQERWKKLEADIKPDKVINLWRTLETECIAERYQPVFHGTQIERKEQFGGKNFYEAIFRKAGIGMPEVLNTEGLYFTEFQEKWGKKWREKHKNDFIIILPIAGSCSHKVWPDMPRFTYEVLDKYPNAYVYLVGDKSVAHAQWEHPRIIHTCGRLSIKQTVLMTRYADLVIGGETGVLVAAGMWGTPKVMLNTASSISQCNDYQKNDYSIQSVVSCSPCHKAVYTVSDCENMTTEGNDSYPACIMNFDYQYIIGVVEKIYNESNIYNKEYYNRFHKRAKTKLGKDLYGWRWGLVEKYCEGQMSLLDYGCASGAFHLSGDNQLKVFGFDVNPYSGFNKLPDEPIDILTMWDVAEHLVEPQAVIQKINPEWLFISTPNKGAVCGDLKKWKHYREGEHLHHFDLNDLHGKLVGVGYEVVEHTFGEGVIRDPGNPQNIITVVARKIRNIKSEVI